MTCSCWRTRTWHTYLHAPQVRTHVLIHVCTHPTYALTFSHIHARTPRTHSRSHTYMHASPRTHSRSHTYMHAPHVRTHVMILCKNHTHHKWSHREITQYEPCNNYTIRTQTEMMQLLENEDQARTKARTYLYTHVTWAHTDTQYLHNTHTDGDDAAAGERGPGTHAHHCAG